MDIDDTIDAFRQGKLEFDCKRMVLTQCKPGGECFEGQGYIRQSPDGTLTFKIYVTKHNAKPFGHLDALANYKAGTILGDEVFYELDATAHDGTRWTATRILPSPRWSALKELTVLVIGQMQSVTAHLEITRLQHYLRLHFFEDLEVPFDRPSEYEDDGHLLTIIDHAAFDACGAHFEVRKREGSADTIVQVTSQRSFPHAFNLRIQESLQYITAKTMTWRARWESAERGMHLELASPWRTSARTQLHPPIAVSSLDAYHKHLWPLFGKYLDYVISNTEGDYQNPVAYHLNNASEASAGAVDAQAVGLSVAVEAVASLISINVDEEKSKRVAILQERMRKWFGDQTDLREFSGRVLGQINALSNRRVQDTLYSLAEDGYVEKAYIKAWSDLRNRQVHPNLNDLSKPDIIYYEALNHNIHCVEVLLHQITFYIISYRGLFTDYTTRDEMGFPITKEYPLTAP